MSTQRQARATQWLGRDLTELADALAQGSLPADAAGHHFDIAIVGSGYGGAMALHELAGCTAADGRPLRIALFERGSEYLPGAFPTRMADLAGHVRYSTAGDPKVRGQADGLFDLRIGPDVGMLLGNGLGGGSLINAGVTAAPLAAVFQEPAWPEAIRHDATLPAQLAQAQRALEAVAAPNIPARTAAMQGLSGGTAPVVVQIIVADRADAARGIEVCNHCGDCATGCNFRAKLSLDVTLLARASARHAAGCLHIATGATVRSFKRLPEGGWCLEVLHTHPHLAQRQGDAYLIRSARLIVAAGTMGSTELLLRASKGGLKTSARIGKRFSANGDNIYAVYGMAAPAKAVADEAQPYDQRQVGPTITRMVDLRGPGLATSLPAMVIQDLGVPGPLRRLFEETVSLGTRLDAMTRFDGSWRGAGQADDAAIDPHKIEASMTVALIGRDSADGRLRLPGTDAEIGTLGVEWPTLPGEPRLDAYQQGLKQLAQRGHPQATVLANPAWQPLPQALESILGQVRGAMVTVHPLGGCVMADTVEEGVVNHLGQVFDGAGRDSVYPDLLVLDGSVVPTSLGINPSLTIAMLAQRALQHLRDTPPAQGGWGLMRGAGEARPPQPRPAFRTLPDPSPAAPTLLQFAEQMRGQADFDGQRCEIELQLWSQPVTTAELTTPNGSRRVAFNPLQSRLRLYAPAVAAPDDESTGPAGPASAPPQERRLLLEAPLSGQMDLLHHAPSWVGCRILRAVVAYILNRGLRDFVGRLLDAVQARSTGPGLLRALLAGLRLASWAGDKRLIAYQFKLGQPTAGSLLQGPGSGRVQAWQGAEIRAVKTLTYNLAASPINQLSIAKVIHSSGAAGLRLTGPLSVDLAHFARVGIPLLRVASQQDQPTALADLATLGLYLGRVLLPLHAWTLRQPDRPNRASASASAAAPSPHIDAENRRLPGVLPTPRGSVTPTVVELQMAEGALLRLSRYPAQADADGRVSAAPPVLMVHGYSASGTTFAHPLLPGGGLAGTLCALGRDVWVLDLRSSAGMPGAQRPWSFEQMGCQDIPLAVDHVLTKTGAQQLDLVAHCMGAAMLSLGLLGDWGGQTLPADTPPFDLYPELRAKLPGRIRRLVLSQVGPVLRMAPSNTARAFVVSWLRQYFKLGRFEFSPRRPSPADDMLDRLLCVVPYPRRDFWRENPFWPPWKKTTWTAARHRMDALYGITFDLVNMDEPVLNAIDDFFGPSNLSTTAQVIAFARTGLVTDRQGRGGFIAAHLDRLKGCELLCLHADRNGLVDYATRGLLFDRLQASGLKGRSLRLAQVGHQDSLIGRGADQTYALIAEFLQ